jgi:hypothetical protein
MNQRQQFFLFVVIEGVQPRIDLVAGKGDGLPPRPGLMVVFFAFPAYRVGYPGPGHQVAFVAGVNENFCRGGCFIGEGNAC